MNHPLQGASTEPLHPTCQNRMSRFIPLALHSLLSGGSRVAFTCSWSCRSGLLHSRECSSPFLFLHPVIPPTLSFMPVVRKSTCSQCNAERRMAPARARDRIGRTDENGSGVLSIIHPMSRPEVVEDGMPCVCFAATETDDASDASADQCDVDRK